MSNTAEFEAKIKEFQKKAQEKAEKQVKRICLNVLENVVQQTPVLTGCARGNWRISFGKEPERVFEKDTKDPGGNQTISTGSSLILSNAKFGIRVNICNSAPYIQRLENGYSRQAPNGMVHITVDAIAKVYGLSVKW